MRLSLLSIFILLQMINPVKSVAAETKLLPLSEYIMNNNVKDKAVMEYTFTRCSAAYSAVSEILDNSGKKFEKLADDYLRSGGMALEQVVILKNYYGNKNAHKKAMQAISGIYDLYIEEANNNWMKTGLYFDNSFLIEDIKICNNILKIEGNR